MRTGVFDRLHRFAKLTYREAKRVVVLVIGVSVLIVGVALLVLPGPAVVVIPLGLSILALEFAWARRWLRHIRDTAEDVGRGAFDRFRNRS